MRWDPFIVFVGYVGWEFLIGFDPGTVIVAVAVIEL